MRARVLLERSPQVTPIVSCGFWQVTAVEREGEGIIVTCQPYRKPTCRAE
ncbi:MAG: hypothetical protein ACRDNE_09845 [Gaiellaceae bacterium]